MTTLSTRQPRIELTTICGSDLHILKGDVPEVTDSRILGREAVGTVEAVGAAVKNVKVGDRVLLSCITDTGALKVVITSSHAATT